MTPCLIIDNLEHFEYKIPLKNGRQREGLFIKISDASENTGWGEIAPLPGWSKETLSECSEQLKKMKEQITAVEWTLNTFNKSLMDLKLLPAVSFGLESALLSLLSPLPEHSVSTSALLMGSCEEILEQAKLRQREGFKYAKLKISNLRFDEASSLISQLKDTFRLRIDVNRAWSTKESLRFFSQFSPETFDYVEEPFSNPHDLSIFPHPLAIDESFPGDLTLEQMETLPTLKAVIYKPTIQGGMIGCQGLHEWARKHGIAFVLSGAFESDLGLAHIASIAHRLSLSSPIGIGTYFHLNETVCCNPLKFSESLIHIPKIIFPRIKSL